MEESIFNNQKKEETDSSSDEEDSSILLRPTSEFRKEFHNPAEFLFTLELEENWKVIKEEFQNLNEQLFHPWPEQNLYKQNGEKGKGWDVFGLYAFGKKHFRNTRLCPKTTEIVERIPGMSTAAFSILTPGSRILPHVGYYGYSELVLRCHLGLIIPSKKEECFLTVGPCQQSWEEGKCMVFDDTFLHSATNHSDETRVVLLLDFSAGELPEGCEEFVDEKPVIDQRGYLDVITAQYGYGINDAE
eukprot:TRINITY_DN13881_c0_g1_i1.p1 TRINITY_DN13881_c0_g1~~TRINITY_DN13881_c0_g1_i1.p1  ORF type:complete len:245 (-),score=67.72 TRINITY_DN13881_c0_g1_i1:36-770(-)